MANTTSFPFSLKLIKGKHWTLKKEDSTRLLLGLQGKVTIKRNENEYEMFAEDLIVINAFDTCDVSFLNEEALIIVLEIHRKEVERQLGMQWAPVLACNTIYSHNQN